MRNKNLKLLKLKLFEGDLKFFLRQLKKRILIPASKKFERPLCGPLMASLIVTYRCNANCVMCNFPSRGDIRKEYSLERWKKIVDDLVSLETTSVSFSGGEPLLWPGIYDLIKYARQNGLLTQMPTNGSLLDEKNCKRIIDSGLHALTISLDGSTGDIHDKVRNNKGLFGKAIEGARKLLEMRDLKSRIPIISFSTVITEENVHDLPNLVGLSETIGVDNISFFSAEGEGHLISTSFSNSAKEFIGWLEEQRRDGRRIDNSETSLSLMFEKYQGKKLSVKCYADYGTIFIDCFGNVFPCNMFLNTGRSVANIVEMSIEQIWSSKEYSRVRSSISACRDCHYVCQLEINELFEKKKFSNTLVL